MLLACSCPGHLPESQRPEVSQLLDPFKQGILFLMSEVCLKESPVDILPYSTSQHAPAEEIGEGREHLARQPHPSFPHPGKMELKFQGGYHPPWGTQTS